MLKKNKINKKIASKKDFKKIKKFLLKNEKKKNNFKKLINKKKRGIRYLSNNKRMYILMKYQNILLKMEKKSFPDITRRQ